MLMLMLTYLSKKRQLMSVRLYEQENKWFYYQKQPLEVFYKSVFLKVLRPEAYSFIQKETLPQVLSYEICEIFNNIF